MSAAVAPVDERRRWRAALDAFAAGLADARQVIADSESPSGRAAANGSGTASSLAWPPGELPAVPMPDDLRAEAESLLQQADVLRDELLAAMSRSRPTGRRSTHPVAASPRWSIRL